MTREQLIKKIEKLGGKHALLSPPDLRVTMEELKACLKDLEKGARLA